MDKSIETLWNMFVEEMRDTEGVWAMYQREIQARTNEDIECNHEPEMQKVVAHTRGLTFKHMLESFTLMAIEAGGSDGMLVFEGDKIEDGDLNVRRK